MSGVAIQIGKIDKNVKMSRSIEGIDYIPGTCILTSRPQVLLTPVCAGLIGMNNLKLTDYANAVLQVCQLTKLTM